MRRVRPAPRRSGADPGHRHDLRVVDHGYVRTLTWKGVRCPSFTAIEAHDPPGPTAEPIMAASKAGSWRPIIPAIPHMPAGA